MKKTLLIALAVLLAAGCCAGLLIYKNGGTQTSSDLKTETLLYFWYEDDNISPENVRYAVMSKKENEPQPNLRRVYKNAETDFEKIAAELKSGDRIIRVIQIYNPAKAEEAVKNEKYVIDLLNEHNIHFARFESRIIDNAPSVSVIQGVDLYNDNFYSGLLENFGEKIIRGSGEEIYRCLYVPSMTAAYDMIKVTVTKSGGELVYGMRDHDENISTKTYTLTKDQVNGLKEAFKNADFWHTLVTDNTLGTDGDGCVIEAVKNGRYHIMDRWAPDYDQSGRSGAKECYEISKAFRRLVPIEDQFDFDGGFSAGRQQKEIKDEL